MPGHRTENQELSMSRSRSPLTHAEVPGAFDAAAGTYDRLVGSNPGYHEHLLASAEALGLPDGGAGLRVLDVGCGTGASTAALLRVAPRAEIIGVDASGEMLAEARKKEWPDTVSFVHSSVEDLPDAPISGTFDAVFAAYLLRNLADPDAALVTLRGLLHAGGVLGVHEYVRGADAGARVRWNAVCWAVIIPMGRVRGGDATLYRHLWRSVNEFDDAAGLAGRLRRTGFGEVHATSAGGWQKGIEYTFIARP